MSKLDLSKIDLDSLRSSSNSTIIIDITPSEEALVIGALVVAIALLLIIYLVRKFKVIKKIGENIKPLAACLSGWFVWCFLVLSYDHLFDAYLSYGSWFTMPPLCLFLVAGWYRFFFGKKKL